MPGPEYAGIVTFYEDFPYAWWTDFRRPEDLGAGRPRRAPGRRVDHPRSTPTSPTSSSARSWASTSTRASSSGCSTARDAMADTVRVVRAGDRRARRASTDPPNATGSPAASDVTADAAPAVGPGSGWSSRSARWLLLIVAIESSSGQPSASLLLPTDGLSRRPRPVRPVGPRHRRQRPAERLRPEPLVPAGDGLRLGHARRDPAGVPDGDRRLRRRHPGADEDSRDARRPRPRPCSRLRPSRPAVAGPSRVRRRSSSTPPSSTSAPGGASTSRSTCSRRWRPSCAPSAAATAWPPPCLAVGADDQAPGPALPDPVRGLVLGDRWVARVRARRQ